MRYWQGKKRRYGQLGEQLSIKKYAEDQYFIIGYLCCSIFVLLFLAGQTGPQMS